MLDRIAVLFGEGLRAEWLMRMGGQPPQVPDDLLRLLLAYHLQEEQLGLDLAVPRSAGPCEPGPKLAKTPANKRHLSGARATSARGTAAVSSLAAGTRLIREWNGQTIRVDVRDEGFVWNRAIYASLSAIARAVTGARWSGPRFFALDRSGRRG